jgi:hypothetical protein
MQRLRRRQADAQGCDAVVAGDGRRFSAPHVVNEILQLRHVSLLEASRFMDTNECVTLISAAKESAGMTAEEIVERLDQAARQFGENARAQFNRRGEF